jgi:hypothetical protein
MELLVFIGVLLVGSVAFARFNQVPPPYHYWCKRDSRLKTLRAWINVETTRHLVFPPPRANTTSFKYWINRLGYTMVGVGIYLAIMEIPGLLPQMQLIIKNLAPSNDTGMINKALHLLLDAGPVASAFVIAVLLPILPPFKTADLYIRSLLYERASIPAQLFREIWRLKQAEYLVKNETLKKVRENLEAEGFDPADIHFAPDKPTSSSLWTKIALLMHTCSIRAADDRYKTAFSILMDCEENIPSYEKLDARFNAIKSDAKICLTQARLEPTDAIVAREDAFKQNCNDFLTHIYNFLSRVSLHSHYSEEERINGMKDFGFILPDHEQPALPDANDLIMLVLVLSGVLIIPLSLHLGISKALLIGAVVYSAILIPIYLAYRFPAPKSKPPKYRIPDIRLPMASAVSAVLFGIIVIVGYRLLENAFDLRQAWGMYASRYPWSFIHGAVAFLIAWRMQTGTYPDINKLTGLQSLKAWGDLKDGLIILVVSLAVFLILVLPRLKALNAAPDNVPIALVILAIMSFSIGLIVPTWYRARTKVKQHDRRGSPADREHYANEYRSQIQAKPKAFGPKPI